jgi:predicted xylose isomerase-like sugar epimerase
VTPPKAEACRKVAEKCGMRIHSVLRGWAEFNSDDASKVEKTFAVTEDALRSAQGYGAETVLLVRCLKNQPLPSPTSFLNIRLKFCQTGRAGT